MTAEGTLALVCTDAFLTHLPVHTRMRDISRSLNGIPLQNESGAIADRLDRLVSSSRRVPPHQHVQLELLIARVERFVQEVDRAPG